MTTSPYVELTYSDLDPSLVHQNVGGLLGRPQETIESGLSTYRLLVTNHVKTEVAKVIDPTAAELLRIAEIAGSIYLGRFNRIVGPAAAAVYLDAYKHANAGDVPMEVIYALAEHHVSRMGTYYNQTSNEALIKGFNAYVNRQVPTRVAANRALDAYGLTSRQMSGYIAMQPAAKVNSATPINTKQRLQDYIGTSIRQRLRIFATQEVHNLDQQAKQTAWLYMQEHGGLSEHAQKVWMTERDERVCKICGPLHGQKVNVSDQFQTSLGGLYVPGAHVNCRCQVRVLDPLRLVSKALDGDDLQEFNHEHPRGNGGRFSAKQRAAATTARDELQRRAEARRSTFRPLEARVQLKEKEDLSQLQGFLDRAAEQVEDVIAPAVETPQPIVMAPQTAGPVQMGVQMTRPVQMTKPIQMSGINMKSQVRDAVRMQATEPFVMPAQMKVEMKQDFIRQIQMSTHPSVAQPKRRLFYAPTVKLDQPVYAVTDIHSFDPDGRIDPRALTFTSDLDALAQAATEHYQETVEEISTDIHYNHGGVVTSTSRGDIGGSKLRGYLDSDEIFDVVEWVARGGQSGELDEPAVSVTWLNPDENNESEWSERVKYGDIAFQWGIHEEDFHQYVLKLEEGHDSSLGSTTNISTAGNHRYEEWETNGVYNSEAYHSSDGSHSFFPSTFINLVPDVEKTEFGNNPE